MINVAKNRLQFINGYDKMNYKKNRLYKKTFNFQWMWKKAHNFISKLYVYSICGFISICGNKSTLHYCNIFSEDFKIKFKCTILNAL